MKRYLFIFPALTLLLFAAFMSNVAMGAWQFRLAPKPYPTFDRTDLFFEALPGSYNQAPNGSASVLTDIVSGNLLLSTSDAAKPAVGPGYLLFGNNSHLVNNNKNLKGRNDSNPITVVMKIQITEASFSTTGNLFQFVKGSDRMEFMALPGATLQLTSYPSLYFNTSFNVPMQQDAIFVLRHTSGGPLTFFVNNTSTQQSSGNGTLQSMATFNPDIGGENHGFKWYGTRAFNRALTNTEIDQLSTWKWDVGY